MGVKCVYQVNAFLVLKTDIKKYPACYLIKWNSGGLCCNYLMSGTELGAVFQVAKSKPESA